MTPDTVSCTALRALLRRNRFQVPRAPGFPSDMLTDNFNHVNCPAGIPDCLRNTFRPQRRASEGHPARSPFPGGNRAASGRNQRIRSTAGTKDASGTGHTKRIPSAGPFHVPQRARSGALRGRTNPEPVPYSRKAVLFRLDFDGSVSDPGPGVGHAIPYQWLTPGAGRAWAEGTGRAASAALRISGYSKDAISVFRWVPRDASPVRGHAVPSGRGCPTECSRCSGF